jgi:hypothetical protein
MEGGEVVLKTVLKGVSAIGWAILAVRLGEQGIRFVCCGSKQEALRERVEGMFFFALQ